ncbi:uncharacterized protein METZ01_LOCUS383214 [marine metagenome]|uniref:Uncharacterized protein n=1 Tax=marine metagenome TaxID=408172 RepID=A0A382U7U5_9ZZZZ
MLAILSDSFNKLYVQFFKWLIFFISRVIPNLVNSL